MKARASARIVIAWALALTAVPSAKAPAQTPPPTNQGLIVTDGSLREGSFADQVPPGTDRFGGYGDYWIRADYGTRIGANLFHSFEQFSVGSGETAVFEVPFGASAVSNVVSRVTGPLASQIDGTVKAFFPAGTAPVGIYLLNPHGILFGSGSTLETSGHFYGLALDSLPFEGGGAFAASADSPAPAIDVVPASEFGFVDRPGGPVLVQDAFLRGDRGVSLVGSDIRIAGESNVAVGQAPGGPVEITASGDIEIIGPDVRRDGPQLGNLLDAPGAAVQSIALRGARIRIEGASTIEASATDESARPIAPGEISMIATESIEIARRPDNDDFNAPLIIDTQYDRNDPGPGDGPSILFEAPRVTLRGPNVWTVSLTPLPAGDIRILGQEISITEDTSVRSDARDGSAGTIEIGTAETALPTRSVRISESMISTDGDLGPTEEPREGNIEIAATDLVHLDAGATLTASVDQNLGGSIRIHAPEATVLGPHSSILARTGSGTGGRIDIVTDALIASPTAVISADAGEGIDGTVNISSPEVDIEGNVRPLDTSYLDAVSALVPSCAARAVQGDRGSLTVSYRRGLRATPDDLLPAFERPIEASDARYAALSKGSGAGSERPGVDAYGAAKSSAVMASAAFRGGRFASAAESWQSAQSLYERAGAVRERSDALYGAASAQQADGRYRESLANLRAAVEAAERSSDDGRRARALGGLANAHLALGEFDLAERAHARALYAAGAAGEPALTAQLLLDGGNLRAQQRDFASAADAFRRAADLADEAHLPELAAHALSSAARAALELGEVEQAGDLLRAANARLLSVTAVSHQIVSVRQHLGSSHVRLAATDPGRRAESLLAAHASFLRAVAEARELGSSRLQSFGYGSLGSLYARESRFGEALTATRLAVQHAEKEEAPDLLYRWLWQEGRILRVRGDAQGAISAYQRAVAILEDLRPEARDQYGAGADFQRAVRPVFMELVDALLETAGKEQTPEAQQPLLAEARRVMEGSRAAELRNYFDDDCAALVASRSVEVDRISRETLAAVVYPIVLVDRLELLVSLPSGIARFTTQVGAEELTRVVAQYLSDLRSGSDRYAKRAQQLYDWLVRPYDDRLREQRIETLVFVPDGVLRTVPMAALHDGEHFLVEKWASAVAPGLSLVEPRPLDPENMRALVAGVSAAVQGFDPLPHAAREISAIHEILGGEVLLDDAFDARSFEQKVAEQSPSIVHVASHAQFTGDTATSFVLAYDDRLTMSRLSSAVAPSQFRRPLELLTLSACETAVGDERAALGLSGVAIRAGARSAIGSLWRISDEAAFELMKGFYTALRAPGTSKAMALRTAQLALRRDPRFAHPLHWSPYLLISNWL